MDVALPAFMGESRAQLIRSREFVHGQLTAEVGAGKPCNWCMMNKIIGMHHTRSCPFMTMQGWCLGVLASTAHIAFQMPFRSIPSCSLWCRGGHLQSFVCKQHI